MWKYFSRGIRETFERRINFSRKDKATGQDCNPIGAIQNKLIPGIVSSQKFDEGTADLGGRCNGSCNDKKQQNEDHGERWRENGYVQQPSFIGALGWSGVLVLGWYLSHPGCHRRRTLPSEFERLKGQTKLSRCHNKVRPCPFKLLSRFVFAQPRGILPQKASVNVPLPSVPVSSTTELQSRTEPASEDVTDSPDEVTPQQTYGPLTAEEALDEAADDLIKAQNSVMSGIENRLGVACMQLGKYKEALSYFQQAAECDYAPAAFNLGLCYETGIGTTQNLKLAAKYYELASKRGHATAMYNLGVFYVHGLGGIQTDHNRARQLFVAAADLGQINAKEALSMVLSPTDEVKESTAVQKKDTEDIPESNNINFLYRAFGIVKSQQIATQVPEPLQDITNMPPKRPMVQAIYEALGLRHTDNKNTSADGFNLEGEFKIVDDVAEEHRDVAKFPIIC